MCSQKKIIIIKSICWNLSSDVMVLGLGHEGGALMNGYSALIEEAPGIPHSSHHVRLQPEALLMNQEIGFL